MSEVIAEFSVTPLVQGEMKPFVDSALDEIKKAGLKHEVGAISTTIEGDIDTVFNAIKNAHLAALNRGADRVVTDIRVDEKKNGISIEEEVAGYR